MNNALFLLVQKSRAVDSRVKTGVVEEESCVLCATVAWDDALTSSLDVL